MSQRSYAELDRLEVRLGRDLELRYLETAGMFEDAEFATTSRRGVTYDVLLDIAVTAGVPAAVQMLANRIKTRRGELAALGHPEYGSRHHELIGEPNSERNRNLIKLYILQALRHEPRIAEVLECSVTTPVDPPRDQVRVELTVLLIDEHEPLNLVVPFSFAGDITTASQSDGRVQ